MAVIETTGLGKDYGELRAVDALDLEVVAGEIFGLLGPNGAGKTTSISMIAGVIQPSRGSARIGGHDVVEQPLAARRLLGLVPQELALYEDITARQNLRFFGRLYGLCGSDLRAAIDWALDVAGLAGRAGEAVTRFSGGMKRRLNLAVGLLHRPRALILDEPTAGVDPQSRAHIFSCVRELNRDQGMTVIYTTHYMEEAESLCSRIGIMDHGKLVALDTLQNLIAAHAPGAVELRLDGDHPEVVAALRPIGSTTEHRGRIVVEGHDIVGEVVRVVEDAGARIRHLAVLEADLETVFLALTGRSLRDTP
jgi:ABC-2 type transport system ATP-binding protein